MIRTARRRRRWLMSAVCIGTTVALGALAVPGATAAVARRAPKACGRAAPSGVTTKTISVGGQSRQYLLEVPPSARTHRPAPLLFNFHGLGSNMSQQAAYSRLNDTGAKAGYVVITPNGSGAQVKTWKFPPRPGSDVPFVKALLTRTESTLCIDRDRVYATGISAGGIFATSLPCAMPGTFAAIAPVAGVNATRVCRAGTPRVSVLAFHGTADPIVPYNGGPYFSGLSGAAAGLGRSPTAALAAGLQAHPVPAAIASWAAFDGCNARPARTGVAHDVQLTTEHGCRKHTGVELYTVQGGGHTWPGAANVARPRLGSVTESISASDLMLAFFHAHPRAH